MAEIEEEGILVRKSTDRKLNSSKCQGELCLNVGMDSSVNVAVEDQTLLLKNTFSEDALPVIKESFIEQLKSGMDDSHLFPIFCVKSQRRKTNSANNTINSQNSSLTYQTLRKKTKQFESSSSSLDLTDSTTDNKVQNPFKKPRDRKLTSFTLDTTSEENASIEEVQQKNKQVKSNINPFKKNLKRKKKYSVKWEKTLDVSDESIQETNASPVKEDNISTNSDSLTSENKNFKYRNPFKNFNKRKRYSIVGKFDTSDEQSEIADVQTHEAVSTPPNKQDSDKISKPNPFKKRNLRKYSLNASLDISDAPNVNDINPNEKEIGANPETQQLSIPKSDKVQDTLSMTNDDNIEIGKNEDEEKCSEIVASNNEEVEIKKQPQVTLNNAVEELAMSKVTTVAEIHTRRESKFESSTEPIHKSSTEIETIKVTENNDERTVEAEEICINSKSKHLDYSNSNKSANEEIELSQLEKTVEQVDMNEPCEKTYCNSLISDMNLQNKGELENEANVNDKIDVSKEDVPLTASNENEVTSVDKQCLVDQVVEVSSISASPSSNSTMNADRPESEQKEMPNMVENITENLQIPETKITDPSTNEQELKKETSNVFTTSEIKNNICEEIVDKIDVLPTPPSSNVEDNDALSVEQSPIHSQLENEGLIEDEGNSEKADSTKTSVRRKSSTIADLNQKLNTSENSAEAIEKPSDKEVKTSFTLIPGETASFEEEVNEQVNTNPFKKKLNRKEYSIRFEKTIEFSEESIQETNTSPIKEDNILANINSLTSENEKDIYQNSETITIPYNEQMSDKTSKPNPFKKRKLRKYSLNASLEISDATSVNDINLNEKEIGVNPETQQISIPKSIEVQETLSTTNDENIEMEINEDEEKCSEIVEKAINNESVEIKKQPQVTLNNVVKDLAVCTETTIAEIHSRRESEFEISKEPVRKLSNETETIKVTENNEERTVEAEEILSYSTVEHLESSVNFICSNKSYKEEVEQFQLVSVDQVDLAEICEETNIVGREEEVVAELSFEPAPKMSSIASISDLKEISKSSSEITHDLDDHHSKLDFSVGNGEMNHIGNVCREDKELTSELLTENSDDGNGKYDNNTAENVSNIQATFKKDSTSVNIKETTADKHQREVIPSLSNEVGIDDVLSAISAVEAEECVTNKPFTPSITLELDPSCILDDDQEVFVPKNTENLSEQLNLNKQTYVESFTNSEGISMSVGSVAEHMMDCTEDKMTEGASHDGGSTVTSDIVIGDGSHEQICSSPKTDEQNPLNEEEVASDSPKSRASTSSSKFAESTNFQEVNCVQQVEDLQKKVAISLTPLNNGEDNSGSIRGSVSPDTTESSADLKKISETSPKKSTKEISRTTSDNKPVPISNQNLPNTSETHTIEQTSTTSSTDSPKRNLQNMHLEREQKMEINLNQPSVIPEQENIPQIEQHPQLASKDVLDSLGISVVTTHVEVLCHKESVSKSFTESTQNPKSECDNTHFRENIGEGIVQDIEICINTSQNIDKNEPLINKENESSNSIMSHINSNNKTELESEANGTDEIDISKEDAPHTALNENQLTLTNKQCPDDQVANTLASPSSKATMDAVRPVSEKKEMVNTAEKIIENLQIPEIKITDTSTNEEKTKNYTDNATTTSEIKNNISEEIVDKVDVLPTPPPSNVEDSDALSVEQSPIHSRLENEPLLEDECNSVKSGSTGTSVRRKSSRIAGKKLNESYEVMNTSKNSAKKQIEVSKNVISDADISPSLVKSKSKQKVEKEINATVNNELGNSKPNVTLNSQSDKTSLQKNISKVVQKEIVGDEVSKINGQNENKNFMRTDLINVTGDNVEQSADKEHPSVSGKTRKRSSRNNSSVVTSNLKSNLERDQQVVKDNNVIVLESTKHPTVDKLKQSDSPGTKDNKEQFGELALSFDISAIPNNKTFSNKKRKYNSTPLVKRSSRSNRLSTNVLSQNENKRTSLDDGLPKIKENAKELDIVLKEKTLNSANNFEFVAPKCVARKSSINGDKKSRRSVTFRPHSSFIPPPDDSINTDKPNANRRRKVSTGGQTSLGKKRKSSVDATSCGIVSANTSSKHNSKKVNNFSSVDNKTNKDISYETSLEVSEIAVNTPKQRKRLLYHSTPKNRVTVLGTPSLARKRIRLSENQESLPTSSSLYTTTETDAVQTYSCTPTTLRTLRNNSSKSLSNKNLSSYNSHTCMATRITANTVHQSNVDRSVSNTKNGTESINSNTHSEAEEPCNSVVMEESSCMNRPPDDSFISTSYSDLNESAQGRSVLEESAVIVETQERRSLRNGNTTHMTLRSSRTTFQQSTIYTETQLSEITQTTVNESNVQPEEKSLTLISKFSKNRKGRDSVFGNVVEKKKVATNNEPLPKLAKPAKWIKKELYTFLDKKLSTKYSLEKRYHCERLVLILYNAVTNALMGHPELGLKTLKEELIKYEICKTQLDYFTFLHRYTTLEFIKKFIPLGRAYGNESYEYKAIAVSDRLE